MVWVTASDLNVEPLPVRSEVPDKQLQAAKALTNLDHKCFLDIDSRPSYLRLTGIICTVGHVTHEVPVLEQLMENGMNIARINLSHRSVEYHVQSIENVRTAASNLSKKIGMPFPVGIAIDIKGPEIRTGYLDGGILAEVELKEGNTVKVTTDPAYMSKCSNQVIYVDYENIVKVMKPGYRIYIDYGMISLICVIVSGVFLTCTVEIGGILGSNKCVNLPGCYVDLPVVSEEDIEDIQLGVEQNVDMVFASFVRTADAVDVVRQAMGEKGKNIKIISKIEDQQGMLNLVEIVHASDGIMIGRGDLGIEISLEKLFIGQKYITSVCNKLGKPVICAREMLESMVSSPIPNCGEISDVANAVIDGVDCVMLTKETVKGLYPAECVKAVSNICKEAEAVTWHNETFANIADSFTAPLDAVQSIAIAAVQASIRCVAAAIFVLTQSGKSAHMISKFHPRCPIIAITRNGITARQAHLYRSVIPIHHLDPEIPDRKKDIDLQVQAGIRFGRFRGFIQPTDPIIVVTEWKGTSPVGLSNTMRIMYVEEKLEVIDDVLYVA